MYHRFFLQYDRKWLHFAGTFIGAGGTQNHILFFQKSETVRKLAYFYFSRSFIDSAVPGDGRFVQIYFYADCIPVGQAGVGKRIRLAAVFLQKRYIYLRQSL